MSLIKCPDCGKEISDSASQCIHCGSLNTKTTNRDKETKKFFRGVGIFGGTLGLIIYSIIALFFILIMAIFSWQMALFGMFILFIIWWFWIKAIRKTRIK
jgi:uncharacterized membrane protein YvbJ